MSATGSVAAEPDIAYVTAGVVAEAETAKEAIARNSAAMTKVVSALKGAGIAARDLQTTSLNVEPRYTQAKDGKGVVDEPAWTRGWLAQKMCGVRDQRFRPGEMVDKPTDDESEYPPADAGAEGA